MLHKLEYSADELLADIDYEAPLQAAGVLCHGGYQNGSYVPPRSRARNDAIAAWRAQLAAAGQPLVHVPDRYVPPNYPNYPQARYLLQQGVRDPVARALTTIAIVEGFGARIRDLPLPDLRAEVVEPLDGTALAHLGKGLFEAHARDEAGHRSQGGHKQMWEAARDLGLARPKIPADVLMRMMSGAPRGAPQRLFPQLSEKMELLVVRMASVLVIEVFAADTFAWAQQLLGDPEVSAAPEAAAHLVSCIAADEVAHVAYLTVALSELRAKTLRSPAGDYAIPGAEVVDATMRRLLRGMATQRPREARERMRGDIHAAIDDAARSAEVARHFESLDSGWTFPHHDDEELDVLLHAA